MSLPILLSALVLAAVYLPSSHTLSHKDDKIVVNVEVPEEGEVGKSIDLKCKWTLPAGMKLYTVKWYKDDHEFFRYVPEAEPRIKTFQQPGVYLDKQVNTHESIRLTKLSLETSGQYKCEVSTEAPSFDTTNRSANLTVIDPPKRQPEISGLSTHYAVGENVTANCTAWPSVPRATISWTINGEPIRKENVIVYRYPTASRGAGSQTVVGLRLEADARYFESNGGTATLGCIAKVGRRKFQAEDQIVVGHVDNQRLSSHDVPRGGGTALRESLSSVILIVGITAAVILHWANLPLAT